MLIKLLVLVLFFNQLLAHVGMVKTTKNSVKVKRAYKIIKVNIGFLINENDIIQTGENSSVGIVFKDGTRLSLGAKSNIVIEKYIFDQKKNNFAFDLNMTKGKAMFESGKFGKIAPHKVKFKVPEGIIGIDGTKFYVNVI